MTVVKITPKPKAAATGSIELRADWLYTHPGGRVIGVVEMQHSERLEPAPDSDKDRTVMLTITGLELASAGQEETLRRALQALYMIRTANGTLDVDGEVQIGEERLRRTNQDLLLNQTVSLAAGVRIWADKARAAFTARDLSPVELRHELEAIAAGLETILIGTPEEDEK